MPRTLDPIDAGPILTGPTSSTTAGTPAITTTDATSGAAPGTARALADALIAFMESGHPREGLFSPDSFCDLTLPTWRLQAQGADNVVGLRVQGHPAEGSVTEYRLDPTPTGFVLEVEETWEDDADRWYCRELLRADVSDGAITELSVYCTGDWDRARVAEHAAAVTLIRP
jgi:hypothetical protein